VVFIIEKGGIYAVDLGLSVKWASCNVGAEKPEEYGDYFAWGEVKSKEDYDWSTYKHAKDYNQLTKYCHNKEYGFNGFVDNKFELDPEDDAATANWGGNWRMPTADELDDLRYSCIWKWTTQNGVAGLLGTSRVEGYTDRTIFFPAAGYYFENQLEFNTALGDGLYWSKSAYDDAKYPYCASALVFREEDSVLYATFGLLNLRNEGLSVRAVCP
jgi:hypothetical protein